MSQQQQGEWFSAPQQGYSRSQDAHFTVQMQAPGSDPAAGKDFAVNDIFAPNSVTGVIAGNLMSAGSQKAQQFYSTYGRINILQPYFDVEPQQVTTRLLRSLKISRRLIDYSEEPSSELYGPLMLAFTLVILLVAGINTTQTQASVQSNSGSAMGTALSVSFGYWGLASLLAYAGAYVLDARVAPAAILSTVGYGLLAYCIALLTALLLPSLSFVVALAVGALSALHIGQVFFHRSQTMSKGLSLGCAIGAPHLLFLLYLRYSFFAAAVATETATVETNLG
eukprot:Colp12_sorted_trinity150504_noHs@15979